MGVKDAQVQGFGAPERGDAALRAAGRRRPGRRRSPRSRRSSQASSRASSSPAKSVVGAKVSGELFSGGLLALGVAIVLMLLYIWFRFQLQFGLGAVIALVHDIILTMGVLSVAAASSSPCTSIAALLTVIGYSMNEKVITFDRLRENLRKYKRMPLRDIINLSENERLSRTLITGSTALLALSRHAVPRRPDDLPARVRHGVRHRRSAPIRRSMSPCR